MSNYEQALAALNRAQRQAVETIDGPVLVVAGPGTGKTQLLTTRIAHILATTDTLPHNILCLTFTESAAQTMRERLANMVGQGAYDVTISTYHAFGADLIRSYPDYFAEFGATRAVDELETDRILRKIFAQLPFNNPLRFTDVYLADIKTFISDAKRALLTPEDITSVADQNAAFLSRAQRAVDDSLGGLVRIDKKSLPRFEKLLDKLRDISPTDTDNSTGRVLPLGTLLIRDLQEALEAAQSSNKTTPITKWKTAWLARDGQGKLALDGNRATVKLRAAAGIYQAYLDELSTRGLFDYDDMILRAIHALETDADLRFTLQERYQYLLLDEFQDTNGAQLRLVELLTDNPVHEDRPNVLAVGDDDQAIYAFQGADYSHMATFRQMYRDVSVISLVQNYRSHPDILTLAHGIAEQIEERLLADKHLEPAGQYSRATVERHDAKSDAAHYAWTAAKIRELLDAGTPPSDIAVLAPQHKYLEPLIPFLHQRNIFVSYEKRENILDDPQINQLLRMSELALALAGNNLAEADALWAEVLSFPFWQVPTSVLWKISWQTYDSRGNWTETMLQHPDLKDIVLFFTRLSMIEGHETLEKMFDYLIGVIPLDLQEPEHETYRSPFYDHYFGTLADSAAENKAGFWDLLTNLIILRARLREYEPEEETLGLATFVQFTQAHRVANIKILNTSPHREAEQTVQLMTTYKAKGQEFKTVFLMAVHDEGWGSKSRRQSSRLSLPANLQFIRYAGATNDERLRLLYVAATRAKERLYMAGYTADFLGKPTTRLKYLQEIINENGRAESPLLPTKSREVINIDNDGATPTTELKAYWQRHHLSAQDSSLKMLLQPRLERFQLSPTHVNSFIDLEKQGPQAFFAGTILRFPQAPNPMGEFGSAIHETLEWIHRQNKVKGSLPTSDKTLDFFEARLNTKHLSPNDQRTLSERGRHALASYINQRVHTVSAGNECEINFAGENILVGSARLGGKVDKLIIDRQAKTITIVDYKTGGSYAKWTKTTKLHRYRQQLYFYKILVESSRLFRNYQVTDAYLEFVEPDEQGNIQELHLQFSADEQSRVAKITEGIWNHIMSLQFPDVSSYTPDLKGIEAFEEDLIRNSGISYT